MSPSTPAPILLAAFLLGAGARPCEAQEPQHVAYPERDILSPFRRPTDVYAPPDELFRLLRLMQAIADDPEASKDFDEKGREVVDDPNWRSLHEKVERLGVDAAYLAQIMRLHRDAGERAIAFYGAFFCRDVDHVLNLISHIPGEPVRRTREAAMPRAVAYLRAHLGRRFGDLDDERKKAVVAAMPQPGSPAANARGIKRLPIDEDHLHDLRLIPFFQLLDLDETIDQAQGLWFLSEVFRIRRDLAQRWTEPALPRIRQLLASEDTTVRDQAIGLLRAIGPRDLPEPPVDDARALQAWADTAARELFPAIRNLNDAIVEIHPGPERDAIVAAARAALETSAIGDPFLGKHENGQPYRGFRVARVPDELRALAIPAGAVVTAINGVGVFDAASLLRVVGEQLDVLGHPRRLVVEFVRGDTLHAIEYRVM